MKKTLRTILILVLLIVLPVLALGYFGFLPAVSTMLGTDKPRDLGTKYSQKDFESAYKSNGVESLALPDTSDIKTSIKYEGKKEIKFSMSASEITALINNNKWKYMPISSVQIKVNEDGTGEASGILHVDRILPYVSLSHSTQEVEDALKKYNIGGNPAFYLKGKVNVENNNVTLQADKIEVGRITIPASLVNQNLPTLESFAESRIKAVPNLNVESLNLSGGKVNFKGTVPAKEYTAQ